MNNVIQAEQTGHKEPPISNHQLKAWIDLTFKQPNDPQRLLLRNKLVSSYGDFFQSLYKSRGHAVFSMMSAYNYGVDSKDIYDQVISYRSSLSDPPTLEQMEVMGIGAVMEHTLPNLEKATLIIKPHEQCARMANAQTLNAQEDWLTSLAFVTYYKDFQFEASIKNRAYEDGVTYLQSLRAGVTFTDIEHVYANLIKTIYPSIKEKSPTIEEGLVTMHSMHSGLALMKNFIGYELWWEKGLIGNRRPGELKKSLLISLLDLYNRFLESRVDKVEIRTHCEILAQVFSKYIFIHPHPDANNSMARILTNNYLASHGIKQIDWSKLKTNSKAYEEFNNHVSNWWYSKGEKLVDWFNNILTASQ